LVDTYNLINRF